MMTHKASGIFVLDSLFLPPMPRPTLLWPSRSLSPPMPGMVVFRVLPPNVQGEKNPLSGEIGAVFVWIPKQAGELIVSLKTGDLVRLTGKNHIDIISGFTSIAFMADTMHKIQP